MREKKRKNILGKKKRKKEQEPHIQNSYNYFKETKIKKKSPLLKPQTSISNFGLLQ